jgi:hypothetical protein
MSERATTAHHFTVEEAEAQIPLLEACFGKIMQLRAQLREAHEHLEQLGEPPTAESIVLRDGPPDLRRARGRFRALMDALTDELAMIESTGAQIKDLDIGLCDFLGLYEGREVWLCWQYGEKQVAFWHELDVGFAGRRPLVERRPPARLLH